MNILEKIIEKIGKAGQKIPLKELIWNTGEKYRKIDLGGKPLEETRVYKYYEKYLHGKEEEGYGGFVEHEKQRFESWFSKQGEKFIGGGVWKQIIEEHDIENIKENKDFIVKCRVEEHFAVADRIQREGVDIEKLKEDPILLCKLEPSVYEVVDGHNRACILLALGENEIPKAEVIESKQAIYAYYFLRYFKEKVKIVIGKVLNAYS